MIVFRGEYVVQPLYTFNLFVYLQLLLLGSQ